MRLSVECVFPYLGKRRFPSRKGALWLRPLTERRTLVYVYCQRLERHTTNAPRVPPTLRQAPHRPDAQLSFRVTRILRTNPPKPNPT